MTSQESLSANRELARRPANWPSDKPVWSFTVFFLAALVKSMMAGAKVAMMTSALLKRGISFLDTIATELLVWMGEHEYDSIKQMQGSMSRNAVPQPSAFERANYMKVLSSYAMR